MPRPSSVPLLRSLLPVLLLALAGPALLVPAPARAQGIDARIVAEASLGHAGERIEVHQHGGAAVDVAFLHAAERALERMEAVLGRALDVATLGPKLRIYVSPATTVSHVWRGYHHPEDPQGILFLNPKIARAGVAGRNATYAHELAHLLAWRFHSHTLREGLADFLALAVHPDAAVGPNTGGHAAADLPPEVVRLLGTVAPPPAAVTDDPAFRAAYYNGSYRLVAHLVAQGGMDRFLTLYEAADPEPLYQALYGASREALVAAALQPAAATE